MRRLKTQSERIIIEKPRLVDQNTLVCRFACSEGIRHAFRTDTFVATYESRDLRQVGEPLLVIPLLANLAPVAWALGATIRVQSVDPVFFAALHKIKEAFQKMYPQIEWNGRILPDRLEAPPDYAAAKPALLFSGGVDSIASYLVHRVENPLLVTVLARTSSGKLPPGVPEQYAKCLEFAKRHGARFAPVMTNLTFFITPKGLPFGISWWQKVRHGLAFLSLCAPLAPPESLGVVYIAATHTARSPMPWGSHPSIDNHVAWASSVARHDCYDISRQQKIALIAEHIQSEDPLLQIQICRRGPQYSNCSKCGKCCRTMIGLAAGGVDPNRHGFRLDQATLRHIRLRLLDRTFLKDANTRFMWRDIQQNLPDRPSVPIEGLEAFFDWFRSAPIS